jgi:hypothetical protein
VLRYNEEKESERESSEGQENEACLGREGLYRREAYSIHKIHYGIIYCQPTFFHLLAVFHKGASKKGVHVEQEEL